MDKEYTIWKDKILLTEKTVNDENI